jgi:hypothetical protein
MDVNENELMALFTINVLFSIDNHLSSFSIRTTYQEGIRTMAETPCESSEAVGHEKGHRTVASKRHDTKCS